MDTEKDSPQNDHGAGRKDQGDHKTYSLADIDSAFDLGESDSGMLFLDKLADESSREQDLLGAEERKRILLKNTLVQSDSSKTWGLLRCEALGLLHVQQDLPCQDRVSFKRFSDSCFFGALADGAGSAKYAEDGANTAVAAAIRELEGYLREVKELKGEKPKDFFKERFYKSLRAEISEVANVKGCEIRDLACTLVAFIVSKNHLVATSIGDSVVVCGTNGSYRVLFESDKGEYINETEFLTSSSYSDFVKTASVKGVDFLAVFSDGLTEISIDTRANKPQEGFFSKFEAFSKSLAEAHIGNECQQVEEYETGIREWMQSEDVNSKSCDDKSLLLATYNQKSEQD